MSEETKKSIGTVTGFETNFKYVLNKHVKVVVENANTLPGGASSEMFKGYILSIDRDFMVFNTVDKEIMYINMKNVVCILK